MNNNNSFFDTYFIQTYFRQYADFNSVTNVKGYWLSVLAMYIVVLGLTGLMCLLGAVAGTGGFIAGAALVSIFSLATVVPSLALCCRRLRDSGKSPWLILLSLIPFVGGIILLVFYCSPSKYQHERKDVSFTGADWGVLGGCLALLIAGSIMLIVSGSSMASSSYEDDYITYDDYSEYPKDEEVETVVETEESYPVPQIDGPKVEVTAPGAFDGYSHEYSGIIDGKYRVNMHLDFDTETGSYYYLTSNASGNLQLTIMSYDPDTRKIWIYEENDAGEGTGNFRGKVSADGGRITGTYTNYQNKDMPFELTLNDAP